MAANFLTDEQRIKADEADDELFYAEPRFVNHLDEGFRSRLTQLYRDRITPGSVVLDLMSSWVSHLPEDIKYKKVIGHGLNKLELERNKQLDSFWVQNFNRTQALPLDDNSVDSALLVAAWQYLQYPEKIALEIKRVVKPKGQLIVSFSNRAFWTKSPRIWLEGSDNDRLNYIRDVLLMAGWLHIEYMIENTFSKVFFSLLPVKGDPFFSVIAKK